MEAGWHEPEVYKALGRHVAPLLLWSPMDRPALPADFSPENRSGTSLRALDVLLCLNVQDSLHLLRVRTRLIAVGKEGSGRNRDLVGVAVLGRAVASTQAEANSRSQQGRFREARQSTFFLFQL